MITSTRKFFVVQLDDIELALIIKSMQVAKEHIDKDGQNFAIGLMIRLLEELLNSK